MNENPTKIKILNAAKELFVENGYAGTSMSQIARLADVNHSLIFHHFKNKEGLWAAVKDSIVQKKSNIDPLLPSLSLPFEIFLKDLITKSIAFYRENTDIAKLIQWQRIEETKQSSLSYSQSAAAWIKAFEHYQKLDMINKKLRPSFILTMVASLASSAALDPISFIQTDEMKAEYINFCVEVITKGLRPAKES